MNLVSLFQFRFVKGQFKDNGVIYGFHQRNFAKTLTISLSIEKKIVCECAEIDYWSRTNYLLVFARLFLYHSVHPFKYPVILNVTLRLTFDGTILNFPVHAHIRDPL